MPPILLLLLQAAPVTGPALPAPERLRFVRDCRADAAGDDVVVCARRDDEFRLKPLPDLSAPAIPRAETGVFGDAKAAAQTEARDVGGFPSNRIMLRLKLPF